MSEKKYMEMAIAAAMTGMNNDEGGPFGAIVIKGDSIVGRGNNKVTSTNDPTAHAEVVAIRDACNNLQTFQLDGCDLYTSCEPCPMCLGAIYWARPDRVFYACTREDAANIGFDDDLIYEELKVPMTDRKISFVQINRAEALKVFESWKEKGDKTVY